MYSRAPARLRRADIGLMAGDHDIDCKVDGIGATQLRSEFVKKA
jgi:protein PhnA